MDEGTQAVPVERVGTRPIARIGLVGAVAAAIVAVGILAAGATATPAGTLAAGTTSGTANAAATTPTIDLPAGAMRDGPRGRFGGMHGLRDITITAISGSKVSLATADGWTRTITVDSGTTYDLNGTAGTLGDLNVGDEIRFGQTRESDGTYSIDAIAVIPPHAGGVVTDTSSSTVSVTQGDGTTATIKVTSATTYDVNGTSGALADIKAGMVVMATGTRGTDGVLTATEVHAGDLGPMGRDHHGFPGDGGGWGGPNGGWGGPNGGAAPDATSAPATTQGSAG